MKSETHSFADAVPPGIDAGRISWIAGALALAPSAAGPVFSDRKAWDAFGEADQGLQDRARLLLDEPMPELTDELYLLYTQKGVRLEFDEVYRKRMFRVATLALAECVEGKGNYLDPFQSALSSILAEKTWVMSADDGNLDNFSGRAVRIDLGAAMRGASIATAVAWLQDFLPADFLARVDGELRRRLFEPYVKAILDPENQTTCRWLRGTSNWNAVCHAGIVITAMAALRSPEERAVILAGAEKYLPFYLTGFTPDGYCSEGLGYWNYGFGHYVLLAEWILRATSGAIDLYADPAIRGIASYPGRMQMAPGVYPAIADCQLYIQPAGWISAICKARLFAGGEGRFGQRPSDPVTPCPLLYQTAVTDFPLQDYFGEPARSCGPQPKADTLRGWFEDAGVLVARPGGTEDAGKISVLLKGGHNNEHHNHNDVGTFVVALNGRQPVIDRGSMPYTRETFSPKRYESENLNSFGHSVPVVAGVLQSVGAAAQAVIMKKWFSPEEDSLLMDLSSAYAVPSLKTLERNFCYSRTGAGRLVVEDRFEFSCPESFEGAVISVGEFEEFGPGKWLVRDEAAFLLLTFDAPPMTMEVVTLEATAPPAFRRLSFRLKQPATRGTIRLEIEPWTDATD